MKSTLKKFLFGFLIGAVLAFPLGMNAGRGTPLLSNPFAQVDVSGKVKAEARNIVDETRGAIHDATRPTAPAIQR